MKKRLICLLTLVCLLCALLCSCAAKEEITIDQAIAIMMEDLGDDVKVTGNPHVHTGKFNNKECYNIFITVNNESWAYVISTDGEILAKGPSSHSH